MHEFKPYVFPLGRRLDGRLADLRSDVREVLVPSLDVEERAEGYVVTAVVPGASKDEVAISFEEGVVRVTGEMPWTETHGDPRQRRDALCFRAFSREVPLVRAVDASKAEAQFEEGVLTARLPFAASKQPQECDPILLKVT